MGLARSSASAGGEVRSAARRWGPHPVPRVGVAAGSASHPETSSLKAETEGRLRQSSACTSLSDLEKMSQERGKGEKKGGGEGERTINSSSRRVRARPTRGFRRRGGGGARAGIPGLAAHPSGRPAPRLLPATFAGSPQLITIRNILFLPKY